MPHVITLLTDFGTTDACVGIVKGVLLARAPDAHVVDLVHAAESGSLYAFGEVEAGSVLAIVGSAGKLEISINRGSAAKKLFVSRTDPVDVDTA